MINIYIKQIKEKEEIPNLEKIPKFLRNLYFKVTKNMNMIFQKEIEENKRTYLLSNINKESTYKKLIKKLEKLETSTQKIQIILSEEIKEYKEYKDYKEYFIKYKIINGKKIYRESIKEILHKILPEEILSMQDVYILTNKYSNEEVKIIRELVDKVKSINIITKQIDKYKMYEDIMQQQGNMLYVSNNKKKSLKRAKIIVNLDFTKEDINKYNIPRDVLIINATEDKLKYITGFNGIIVQDIEPQFTQMQNEFLINNSLNNNFNKLELYESIKQDKNDHINIISLYGNNGKIGEKELVNYQKILTNLKN